MFRFVIGIGGRAADEHQAALGLHDINADADNPSKSPSHGVPPALRLLF